jgi:membrane fusion protein (multidrug efflux system)
VADEQNQSVPQAADPTAEGQGNVQNGSRAGSEPVANQSGNGNRTIIVIVVVVLLTLAAGFFYWRATFTEDTDDAQVDGNLYQISARISGQVVKVYVSDNQTVQAGQLLAEIDPTDYQVALDQAEANLASAQADYTQATANVPITQVSVGTTVSTTASDVKGSTEMVAQVEKQVDAAKARVDEAKANAQKAQDDVDRYTPLVQKDVISKQQYDTAVQALSSAKAAVVEAGANVLAQENAVSNAKARLAQSQAQSEQSVKNGPEQVRVQQSRAVAAAASIKQAEAKRRWRGS